MIPDVQNDIHDVQKHYDENNEREFYRVQSAFLVVNLIDFCDEILCCGDLRRHISWIFGLQIRCNDGWLDFSGEPLFRNKLFPSLWFLNYPWFYSIMSFSSMEDSSSPKSSSTKSSSFTSSNWLTESKLWACRKGNDKDIGVIVFLGRFMNCLNK